MDRDAEVDVEIDRYFGCFKGVAKSVDVLLDGIEPVVALTWRILK